jgi:hypothetical protein
MPNNWAWQWNQPYQSQMAFNNNHMQQPQQPINNIVRVTGPESAKAYPLPEKSSVILFDAENPIFYLKTTDDGGFPNPLKTFSFQEIKTAETQQPVIEQVNTDNLVTKQDFENLEKNVSELKEMLEDLVN